MTEDYTMIDPRSGSLTLDISRLMKISNKEFLDWRLNEMKKFIDNHLSFTGHYPGCHECKELISDFKGLVRYFGASLHPNCFKELYNSEREKLCKSEQEYFDRVVGLFN